MKLHELAYVLGDDGGLHHHIDKAIRNMEHHGEKHKSKDVRDACVKAANAIKRHAQNPVALYDDPHTLVKILSVFHGEPDLNRITHASDSLGSYTQSDSE